MASPADFVSSLVQKSNEYIETRVDLLKLKAIDRLTEVAALILSSIAVIFLVALFVFIISIGLAIYIGNRMGELYEGFFIVGGFFAILCIIVYACRGKWLKTPFMNRMIDKILN